MRHAISRIGGIYIVVGLSIALWRAFWVLRQADGLRQHALTALWLGITVVAWPVELAQDLMRRADVEAWFDEERFEAGQGEDCEYRSESIAEVPALSPQEAAAGASFAAGFAVESVEPARFNTLDGEAPAERYRPYVDPDYELSATAEAVFRRHLGPDWLGIGGNDVPYATMEAIERDFDAQWMEHTAFDLGHLVVLRVTPEYGVLRGDPATARIVTWVRGGERRVDRGPNAGCVFGQRHAGIEAPTAGDRGIVIADPFDEIMREAWYGVGRCEQMAAALSAESGEPAICGRVGSLWHVGEDDIVWSWTYWAREEGTSVDVLLQALGVLED